MRQSAGVVIPDIILIGPIGSGKSTVGALLASGAGVPQVSSYKLCWEYYEELGFPWGMVERGPDGMIVSRCNVHALGRLLEDYRNWVMDLGGGPSVYRDDESLAQVSFRSVRPGTG